MMKTNAELFKGHQDMLATFRALPSGVLFTLYAELEEVALARIEEEELARTRKKKIAEFLELLAKDGITPEELVAYTRGTVRASKRNR